MKFVAFKTRASFFMCNERVHNATLLWFVRGLSVIVLILFIDVYQSRIRLWLRREQWFPDWPDNDPTCPPIGYPRYLALGVVITVILELLNWYICQASSGSG